MSLTRMRQLVQERNKDLNLPDCVKNAASLRDAQSYLMGAVRALYYPEGAEPSSGAAKRDARILRDLTDRLGTIRAERAVLGAALMRDRGRLAPMVEPGEAMTTRVLLVNWGGRRVWVQAEEACMRAEEWEPAVDYLGDAAGIGR